MDMQKLISAFTVASVLLLGPVSALAFEQPTVLCPNPGHPIWSEVVNTSARIVGCISDADWQRGNAEAAARNVNGNILSFAINTSVVLKDGRVATCPWWFPYTGCVIARSLLK